MRRGAGGAARVWMCDVISQTPSTTVCSQRKVCSVERVGASPQRRSRFYSHSTRCGEPANEPERQVFALGSRAGASGVTSGM